MMAWRRFSSRDWYEAPPKQPVPADGIAAKSFGRTWWGREWIASLERLGRSWSNRLPRGRSYARQGRVIDLAVGAGEVTAGVVGSRSRAYRVEIGLEAFSKRRWMRAIEKLENETMLVIRLLDRDLPDEVGEVLRSGGVELFPTAQDLKTHCSCPDVANPCKHVAAVHYLFAAALDNDPFLLFRLRGLDREALVSALGGEDFAAPKPTEGGSNDQSDDQGAVLDSDPDEATFLGRDLRLPLLDIDPCPAEVELLGLKRLGPPPRGLEDLARLVSPAIRAAARLALQLAWDEPRPIKGHNSPPPGARDSDVPEDPVPKRPEDLGTAIERILSDANRPLSKSELAGSIGVEPAELTPGLGILRRAGLVARTGRGSGSRYALAQRASTSPSRKATRGSGGLEDRVIEVLKGASPLTISMRAMADELGVAIIELRAVVLSLRQNGVVEKTGHRRSARYRLAT